MGEKELTLRTFDEIKGLNGEVFDQWNKAIRCFLFTKDNFKDVFKKIGHEKEPIVYCLSTLREIQCGTKREKDGVSSTILMSRMFYIGQSSSGLQRIAQHCTAKDSANWWEIGAAFYSENFTIDIIRSIESIITGWAKKSLPDYSLVSDPKNTFEGRQPFPTETTIPFIQRVLGWMGIESNQDQKESSYVEPQSPVTEPATKGEVIFENLSHTAKLSFSQATGEMKLLKGSKLADPNSQHPSLLENFRQAIREAPKDENNRLTTDMVVSSPSFAAKIVRGYSVSGNADWVSVDDHITFGEFKQKMSKK